MNIPFEADSTSNFCFIELGPRTRSTNACCLILLEHGKCKDAAHFFSNVRIHTFLFIQFSRFSTFGQCKTEILCVLWTLINEAKT